jgi:hypothetical protein
MDLINDETKPLGEPKSLGDILKTKAISKKPPAYPWQDLALRIEKEINIPKFKRSAVFKVCRDYPRSVIERCLADTKELCQSGEKWRYFFKTVEASGEKEKHTQL